jgi:putative ABC transport system permease protein
MGIRIEGGVPEGTGTPSANTLISSAGYFDTVRMTITQGRDFAESDIEDRQLVAIVNEAFVRRYLPDGDPLGRNIGTGFDGLTPVRSIVGVVGDTHDRGVNVAPIPTVYLPVAQFNLGYGAIAVRTSLDADIIVPSIRSRLQRLNPAVPLTDFQSLDDRLHQSLREPRFYTMMATMCALLAMTFVTFGLYGLISYSVGRRRMELGIRMAIGADRGSIVRLVLGQGLRMGVVGIVLGVGLSMLTARSLESQLFQVEALDPWILFAAAATVILATQVATIGPARRAGRVDPMSILRQQ